jgi:AAA+ superfamily predicted ATPase
MSQPDVQPSPDVLAYANHFEHLTDELVWLDLVIQIAVTQVRADLQPFQRLAANRQVCITAEEVDWLLSEHGLPSPEIDETGELSCRLEQIQQTLQQRVELSLDQGVSLPLVQLAQTFGLSPFEVQAIIICLAPELKRKYDRLYAYLQDDITRKRPSIDLILTLLCPSLAARWQARSYFLPQSPLLQLGILHTVHDAQSPSGSSDLAQFLQLDRRIVDYLLGHEVLDDQLIPLITVQVAEQAFDQVLVEVAPKAQLKGLLHRYFLSANEPFRKVVMYFHGPPGVGKRELALGASTQLGCSLLYLDLERLLTQDSPLETLLKRVFREGLLLQAAIYLDHLDRLLSNQPKARMALKLLADLMAQYGWLLILAGETPWYPDDLFDQGEDLIFQDIALPIPDVPIRAAMWNRALEGWCPHAEESWAWQLASQFCLTPGQIRAAARRVEGQPKAIDGGEKPGLNDLYAACRRLSSHKLGELAVKLEPHYSWADLVLPEDKLTHLRELCSQARHQYRVLQEWGFGQKLSHGKGLSALFSGPPGTGKTMAAEVIAHDLQVDLYKVDLSGVVSKYIGETEKNLSRIFQAAKTSNAILFFDEADALFGKRTEVSDAHDRYANIETSYLLQKMEEYDGIVILATNLRENMDEAFTRRLRFIVEFPFPDDEHRRRIWATHFPEAAPLSEAVDCEVLAHQFQLAGGNIKNIVLNAAFYAAEDGEKIEMEHIVRGAKREFEKMGKLWREVNFSSSKRR